MTKWRGNGQIWLAKAEFIFFQRNDPNILKAFFKLEKEMKEGRMKE